MASLLRVCLRTTSLRIIITSARKSSAQKAQAITSVLTVGTGDSCAESPSRGLVLGVYTEGDSKSDGGELTRSADRYNTITEGRLLDVLRMSGPMPKVGEARVLFAVEKSKVPYYSAVAMIGLGDRCMGYDSYEVIDKRKDAIRRSVAAACMELCRLDTDRIEVESCGHAESAAEGAGLGIWAYQELKDYKKRLEIPSLDLYTTKDEICDLDGWRIGLHKAEAQNLCRELQEAPANIMTPTSFAEKVINVLCKTGVNVEVKVEGWAQSQNMNAFLAVGKASCEAPIFLELGYHGGPKNDSPIVLVGQGITYDSGGLNLKTRNELKVMRGDMTGAAVVVAACKAISSLRLPINIRALIPLCENLMGCNAFRPGDMVKSINGKTIVAQGTDHEDVMVLADALLYAQNFCPKMIVDIGTTSGGMRQCLDEAACGVFTNSEILWQKIKNASIHTGDRVWRFPLWDYYSRMVTEFSIASDVQNYGIGIGGRPCKAAAFLRQFVPCGQWMHIDCTNVMYTNGKDFEDLRRGMSGRPTRTLIEFIAQTLCKNASPQIPPES